MLLNCLNVVVVGGVNMRKSSARAVFRESVDWRRETLARIRALIQEADPGAVEEAKWKKASNPAGVPTWSHGGIICTGETYRDKVKLTFARGAALKDPARLFNAGLDGGTRRAIDIPEGGRIDEAAFKALIRAAVALNTSKVKSGKKTAARPPRPAKRPKKAAGKSG
jgi:hypothetical protein